MGTQSSLHPTALPCAKPESGFYHLAQLLSPSSPRRNPLSQAQNFLASNNSFRRYPHVKFGHIKGSVSILELLTYIQPNPARRENHGLISITFANYQGTFSAFLSFLFKSKLIRKPGSYRKKMKPVPHIAISRPRIIVRTAHSSASYVSKIEKSSHIFSDIQSLPQTQV